MTQTVAVQCLTERIDGSGPTVVLPHGWPHTPAVRDGTATALCDGYRCVRLHLRCYGLFRPPQPVSVNGMCALIAAAGDTVSPDEPVGWVPHDWPGSRVHGFDTGHWLMLHQLAEYRPAVHGWLDKSTAATR